MIALTAEARAFINGFQGGFPIVERPFQSVAAKLGMTETVLIQTVRQLLDDGVLSRFGPLYDAARLGGHVTLAALAAPPAEFDRIAGQVNGLPAVAHNYRREHPLNMWFVVASDRHSGVESCLADIERITGQRVYDFPKLREFYLGLWLALDADGGVATVPVPQAPAVSGDFRITAFERDLIAATQAGLPPVVEPFARVADQLGSSVEAVMQGLEQLLANGVIRRIGAVPNHYKVGLKANGMTVWDVPDTLAVELGERVGALDFVSHAYLRPRYAGVWPYNLFAMVHGRNRDEVRRKADRIEQILAPHCRAHDVLFSSQVLKKTGLRLAA